MRPSAYLRKQKPILALRTKTRMKAPPNSPLQSLRSRRKFLPQKKRRPSGCSTIKASTTWMTLTLTPYWQLQSPKSRSRATLVPQYCMTLEDRSGWTLMSRSKCTYSCEAKSKIKPWWSSVTTAMPTCYGSSGRETRSYSLDRQCKRARVCIAVLIVWCLYSMGPWMKYPMEKRKLISIRR